MDLVRGVCGAHGGYETADVRAVRRIGGRHGLRGGAGKEWMGCFLDDLRAFGINADQSLDCSTGRGGMTQDGEIRGRTCHGEMDRCRDSQGWTTAYRGVPERDGKDQGGNNPKQVGSCWFARSC